jgi:glycosyltransferase involved in cell wall biosynthesis
MRILIVHPSSHLNGAGRMVGLLAKYLKGRGHDIRVILPEDGPLCQTYADDVGQPDFVAMTLLRRNLVAVGRHALEFPSTVVAIKRIIAEWKPDLVHVNCLYNIWGGTAARWLKVPCVYHVHEAPGSFPTWLYWLWQAAVSQLANRVVAVSDALGKALPSCREKLEIIENGVDVERFKPTSAAMEWRRSYASPHQRLILCPSHIMPGKNQALLVSAAPMILGSVENAVIVFLGSTNDIRANQDYFEEIESLSGSLGCGGKVFFTDQPVDAGQVYAAADLVVYPSKYESFGLVTLESLAAGKPVISAKTGVAGKLEALGYPVRTVSGDSPEELAGAVVSTLKNPPQPETIRLPAELTAERVAEEFEAVHRNVLAESRRDHS